MRGKCATTIPTRKPPFDLMFGIETFAFFLGMGLCVVAALAVASWTGQTIASIAGSRQAHQESTRAIREAIRTRAANQSASAIDGSWSGYRNFVVTRIVRECFNTVSVYLEPEDGKPIADFKPGQHITLRFQPKGKAKPLVRCYSLSDSPGKPHYRITVKHLEDRGDNKGPGVVSTIINYGIQVGHRIPIKAPSGHFQLEDQSNDVAVLLAGGIGVTPMVSMLEHLVDTDSQRSVLLIHGVRNGKDQPFQSHLRKLSQENPNVHVVSCYSKPNPDDVKGVDYQVSGFASIALLQTILPGQNCQFHLCGPPAFMESLHQGLLDWGVDESRIRFEQFGPSTIRKSTASSTEVKHDEPDPVSFIESDEMALWSSNYESLLELAEAHDIPIESGCRAGSCGTCETAIISGKVRYLTGQQVSCNPGCCLPCIAVPDGPLELEV